MQCLVNCTGEKLRILTSEETLEIEPEEVKAEVEVTTSTREVELHGVKVSVVQRIVRGIKGLPPKQYGVFYIVDRDVLQASRRTDLLTPGEFLEITARYLLVDVLCKD